MKPSLAKPRVSSTQRLAALAFGIGLAAGPLAASADVGIDPAMPGGSQNTPKVMWLNHFDLLSGDESVVTTSHNSTDSGVGTGLTGLVITSSTVGEVDSFGGSKVVHMALDLPKQTKVTGVRVCYQYGGGEQGSFISNIRLAQLDQAAPDTAKVVLDDDTDLVNVGPVCVSSKKIKPHVSAIAGPMTLSLRVNTSGNVTDRIVIRGVGLFVE